jgi:hypothetical protein
VQGHATAQLQLSNQSPVMCQLGIAIMGGLLISQMLTLYTTPVVYLYFDRLQQWRERTRAQRRQPSGGISENDEPVGSEV